MNKKTLLVLGLVLVLSVGMAWAAEKGSWTGYISDAKCGAKGAKAAHAGCAKKCIEGGQAAVFVTDDGGTVLEVTNQDKVKEHAGHHVKVEGTVDAKKLTVDKVTMVEEK
jgi:hypothetical protein